MKRPSPNATPARGPADPISPALRLLLSPLGTAPGGANGSEPGRIGRVGFWAEDGRLLVPAVLGAAAAGKWRRRWWSSGEFGAGRRVPIPSSSCSSLFRLFSSFPSSSPSPPLDSVGFFPLAFFPANIYTHVWILITAVKQWSCNTVPVATACNYQRRHAEHRCHRVLGRATSLC